MGEVRRFPSWLMIAVLVVSAVNVWAIRRRGPGPGLTASQVAGRDDVTRLITDGESAASGRVRPTDVWWRHLRFEQITWSRWSDEGAEGQATAVVNTCDPGCPAGNTESYRVDVEVSGPAAACGGHFFSTLTWARADSSGRGGSLDDILPFYPDRSLDGTPCP